MGAVSVIFCHAVVRFGGSTLQCLNEVHFFGACIEHVHLIQM